MSKHLGKLFTLLCVLFLVSCGYKPASKYARVVVGEKISTDVIISSQDPENTVVIKDAVDAAVIEIFRSSLVARSYADTHLVICLLSLLMLRYSLIVMDLSSVTERQLHSTLTV